MKWSNIIVVFIFLATAFVCLSPGKAVAADSKLVAKGRLHSVVDNVALLATPIKGKARAQLKMAGFRPVSKKKNIGPGTIYKKNLYIGYTTRLDAKVLKRLKRKIGRRVQLILKRIDSEQPVVIGVK